jgi:hypothetical protein
MAGGKSDKVARQHPGFFRELLDQQFAEEAEVSGPWLSRIIQKLKVDEPEYVHELFSGIDLGDGRSAGQINIYCLYAAYEFDSRTKRFRYDFNEVIRECGRKAENQLREQLDLPLIGEGWIAETALYHALRDAFSETDVVHHGRPHWLGRQHFDVWFPLWRIAVERHGLQHFESVEFFGGSDALEKTQERDRRKADAARAHGVRLIVATPEMSPEEVIGLIRRSRTS